jgi:tetratricopeptide (TPR) repeat protein
MNRNGEAVEEARQARVLEPLLPDRYTTLGIIRYYGRDFDGALADMRQALSVAPNYRPAVFGIGRILLGMGRYAEAIEQLQFTATPEAIAQNPSWLAHLGMAYALAGRTAEVEGVLARLRAEEAHGRFISIDNYAYIAGNQGRLDEAFALLDQAVRRRMTNVLWLAVDPRADALRRDPRFDRVVQAMDVVGK